MDRVDKLSINEEWEKYRENYRGQGLGIALGIVTFTTFVMLLFYDLIVPDARYNVKVRGREVECSVELFRSDSSLTHSQYIIRGERDRFVRASLSEDKYSLLEEHGIGHVEAKEWLDACAQALQLNIDLRR